MTDRYKRILVCGGRNFSRVDGSKPETIEEYKWVFKTLEKHVVYDKEEMLPVSVIISGKAKGVDTTAIDFAVVNWLEFEEHPADWEKFGKKAGYIRNRQMLIEGRPDVVIAFPGGRGTDMMVSIAKEANIPVLDYRNAYTSTLS